MAPKRRLPQTFPHKITLVISLVLCLCACACIVLGVISLTYHLWGYNFATGFWTGGVILLAGMFGIGCSCARNTCSVKTFMIISIFGCLASLGMIALSCGGLDASSGFYQYGQVNHSLTHTVHAINLGLGILQLALCVLSDGLCFYYLFYEQNSVMYRVGSTSMIVNKSRKGSSKHSRVKDRSSNGSEMPLMQAVSENRKNSKIKSKTEAADSSNNVDTDLMVVYATNERQPLTVSSLRQQEAEMASASPSNRYSGVTTFGHLSILGPDQVSLIVHPNDDNASVADTVRTHTPDPLRYNSGRTNMHTENHYAQTLLFEPPLPIEEDDELPPYEAVDSRTSGSVVSDNTPTKFSINIQRSMSLPSRGRRQSERRERTSLRSNIPAGRRENFAPGIADTFEVANKKLKNVPEVPTLHVSRSAHLLQNTTDFNCDTQEHPDGNVNTQGVLRRKFDYLDNKIPDLGVTLRNAKSQSMYNGREKRLDRRRRALSAEIKWNKDVMDYHGSSMSSDVELRSRTSSMGSGSSLFADSRLSATKFSLRTPMRHSGTQQANVPVPVKPPQAGMFKSPPPKPPRTFSFNEDDLQANDREHSSHTEVEHVFGCIEGLKNAIYTVPKDTTVIAVEHFDKTAITDSNLNFTAFEERRNENALTTSNAVAVLDSGPVLQCVQLPSKETVQQKYAFTAMTVPTSPVLILSSEKNAKHSLEKNIDKKKIENVSKQSSADNEYKSAVSETAVISPLSPGTTIKKSRKLLFSFSNDNNVSVFDPSPDHDNLTRDETECVFEIKEEISVIHHQQELINQTRIPSSSETGELKRLSENQSGGLQNITSDPQKLKSVEKNSHDTNANIESLSNLRVRLPPLSPLERILQRKNLNSNIEFGEDSSRPKIHKPDAPKVLNGARPKYKLSECKPTSLRTEPSPGIKKYGNITANLPVTHKSQGTAQFRNRENRNYAIPTTSKKFPTDNSYDPVVCSISDSGMETLSAGCLPSAILRSQAAEAPRVVSPIPNVSFSPQDVIRPSDSVDSQNVQGVLRLPQSQHARLLSNQEHPVAHAQDVGDNINANGAVNVQHNDRPLFSTIL
ncbi:uncharacterized protein LOC127865913 [Dreissena polymorpha]|uniref:Uncharacterized protein n=1 Tax=Dreissena polymorpha TaxID=45954 RepID=A0A9D4RBI0_DREPO|nr:uncharacterized protein LOC127865913 [Dreissena polymorpha]KAH3861403.1 hypothetical protein DPMN_024331 [Dreissena polymorpha]